MPKNGNRFPFYKRNPFNIFRENKKKIEITFYFTKEIPLKMNRTKKKGSPKNWNHLQFYKRNPFKNESDQKKRFTKKFKSPSILQKKSLYICFLQFYKRNPFKISSFFIKGVNFTKEIPLNFSRKKINPEIWSQKYPLGPASWRSFLKKVTQVVRFWKSLGQLPNLSQI